MKSGFVALVGRPNVGKSSILNQVIGRKITIVSDKPQTTRRRVHGVVTRGDSQIVFVDTPGLHKPVSALGQRVNATALSSANDVDVIVLVIDASKGYGKGDKWVYENTAANRGDGRLFVVLNKCDAAKPESILAQLSDLSDLGADEYFPVSAKSGKGIDELVAALFSVIPDGEWFYPEEDVTDVPEEEWVAELVREELLRATRDELPYSIATRVTEWEWPRVRCEIVVERDSQKGMVIGKGGALLKQVGEAVRHQMKPGVFLELHVTVDKNWQQRADRVERLGY